MAKRELEHLGFIVAAIVQRFGQTEGQRAKASDPGDAKAHRIAQLSHVDIVAVRLVVATARTEDIAGIQEVRRAHRAVILDEGQREEQFHGALDQDVAPEWVGLATNALDLQLAGAGIYHIAVAAIAGGPVAAVQLGDRRSEERRVGQGWGWRW